MNREEERERDQLVLEAAHRQAEQDEAMVAAIRRSRAQAVALGRRQSDGAYREAGRQLVAIYDLLQAVAEEDPHDLMG